ncbi:trichothecene 3-o-acetyltransferase [Colletotrichum truncatum]|uniref:Trichothecene 3-o-acetyltransferase n=1 Tax=Colletotrichum truncatum TaxID=5467 RepID=A0ACC3YWA1_COLTU|nr:trichothecene 3-o-acetyltransferase [Colletotrichum truncatum]KAF6787381.1 trichothecene 3-o-acetyltransferase [Colletotrichum truncatum]
MAENNQITLDDVMIPKMLHLTPLDQIAPRIYVRTIFVFTLTDGYDAGTATDYLRECFHRALSRWPFLSGQIRPAAEGRNRLELLYTGDTWSMNPSNRPEIFRYEKICHLNGHNFKELVGLGMPPSTMNKDVLSNSPNHPKPGESCPPVTMKVTEMNGKGLFVCFSTHHGIFDGGFIKTFLEYFAQGANVASKNNFIDHTICNYSGPDNDKSNYLMESKSMSFFEDTKVKGKRWLTEVKERPKMDCYKELDIKDVDFPEYDFTKNAPVPNGIKTPKAVCKIFKFDNSVIEALRVKALAYVRKKYGDGAFVSMVDTLSALVWVYVTRSRISHLSPSDDSSFSTAVDARPRLSPAFPLSSWGNIYTQNVARAKVQSLTMLDEAGKLPNDATSSIFEAAWLIRQAVDKVNKPDYIPSRIALAASLKDPAMEGAAFRKANRPDHAGLGCSVWVHMGADVDFGIPGTGGKADYVRKTWSANDGTMNIMQRRGVTRGDAPWEVLLALREDDMDRVCCMNALGHWAMSWCA